MKLTTLISLMNGYAKLYHETEVKKISSNSVLCEEKSFIHCKECVYRSACNDDGDCYLKSKSK
jgi:hypothetical protein